MRLKNCKLFGKRGLSVLLSLVLCLSMASPAFAASFSELDAAIKGDAGDTDTNKIGDSGRYGYGKYNETDDIWDIEAWNEEDTRHVKLNEDVTYNNETDSSLSKNGNGIEISGENTKVTLDLNGKTIDLNPKYTFDGSSFKDTAGNGAAPKDLNTGRIFSVKQGASLTVNDSSAIKKDAEGKEYYDREAGSGQIKGGNSNWGAGVSVSNGSFTMNGGSITGNKSSGRGGGIATEKNTTIELNGVNISGNGADSGGGGGLYLSGTSTTTIKGSAISGNKAGWNVSGGGIYAVGYANSPVTINISDSKIEGNSAGNDGGGIDVFSNVTLNMTNTEVNDNMCGNGNPDCNGGAIYAYGKSTEGRPGISLTDVSFAGNSAGGKPGYTGNGMGGALYLENADVTVNDSVAFGRNTAKTKVPVGPGNNRVIENDIYIKGENGTAGVTINAGGKLVDIDKETGEHISETTYPDGATVVKDGDDVKVNGSSVTKTDNKDGTVTIATNNGTTETSNTFQVTDPDEVVVDKTGTTTIPGGSKVTGEDGSETTYPNGAVIDKDGNVTGDSVTKTTNDGTTTITSKTSGEDGTEETVTNTVEGDVTVNPDGTVTIPAGGKVTDGSGSETTYPDGATIDAQGKITAKDHDYQVTETKDATCTEAGSKTEVCTICGDTKVTATGPALEHDYAVTGHADASCTENGFTTETCTRCQDEKTTVLEAPGHTEEIIPAVPATETESGWTEGIRCSVCGTIFQAPAEIPATGPVNPENPEQPENPETPETPDVPAPGGDDDFGNDGAGTATIAEQDVPLAGIVLVKDVLAELYNHAGSPDGEDAEGEYVKAIAWAIANGIVDADYDVDAVVTVAVLKSMLTNYAASVGGVLTASIDGEDDDVVMNCGEILAKVFETL